MKKEIRTIIYDEDLHIEAYRLQGIVQPFPNHFHEYYVVGLIEDGSRYLSCRNKDYTLEKGDVVLFNPGDNHACAQIGGGTLDYRGVNIPAGTMLELAEEVTGKPELPGFSKNVVSDGEIACYLRPLHEMILEGSGEFGKEENLLLLVSLLIQNYGKPFEDCVPECREEVEAACAFMEEHFMEPISLDRLCRRAGLTKSTLLRAFAKSKGITPYRYLETVRINKAKKLLEQGAAPIEAALQTGFSDQSHFTNYFNSFMGLSPGMYRRIFCNKNKADEERHGE